MKKIVIIMVIVLIGSMQSCSEYLEETNPNFLSTDTYWRTLDESESNLTSVYGAMVDHYILDLERELYRTDLAFPGQRTNPTTNWLPWYQHRINFDDSDLQRRWESKYRVIWRANQVIEGLNGMSDDLKAQARWKIQMGQARFFRGLMHFYLHSEFNQGKIVIRDAVPKSAKDYAKSLSTSDEVKTFFRADLEYAYANLPAKMEPKSRVDGGAAATILGTSYLYEGNYDKAKEYFNDIINNVKGDYGYALVQDVSKMFTGANDFSSESIFEINYAENLQPEDAIFDEESFFNRLARWTAPPARNLVTNDNFGGQGQLLPSAWLTYEYSKEPMDTKDVRNHTNGLLTGPMRTIPLRASQSIAVVNDEISPYYGNKAPQVFSFGNTRFSLFKKYTNHAAPGITNEFQTATSPWKSGRNIVINRLAGVYLMQAECLIQGSAPNVQGAIDLINTVRKRWGLRLLGTGNTTLNDYDGVAYTTTTLMNHLMYKEYPLELSFEGFNTRFNDMRRWGITAQRFNSLSNEIYSVANYTYTKLPSGTATRNNSLLVKGPGNLQFTEYNEAAQVWAAKDLGYFPIPQNETLNNNSIK
ncbi:RagB/SusD family nutrient uptake outer membrane protein [Flavobacterium sp. NG2]|uniref:RagB/SusD family nutrient uptake outer membrane protein n=1 Tax=Flavobacterium sp. NG2 TaxID=3097547 RepID=UPI002A8105F4|nr:RagB/SusD family nutrient uptake outer membrane protein [Flavobacterium sp. NG2]WPR71407.1 RagB/SusD family nutrient uptake outer membrane protein [Flavobacterium sp. NG2]